MPRKPCDVRGRFADVCKAFRFRAGTPMSIFSRSFWRSVSPLLCVLSSVCAAQQGKPQFTNVPQVEQTGGRVASFLTGNFQQPPNLTDILYIGAPTFSGTTPSI